MFYGEKLSVKKHTNSNGNKLLEEEIYTTYRARICSLKRSDLPFHIALCDYRTMALQNTATLLNTFLSVILPLGVALIIGLISIFTSLFSGDPAYANRLVISGIIIIIYYYTAYNISKYCIHCAELFALYGNIAKARLGSKAQ